VFGKRLRLSARRLELQLRRRRHRQTGRLRRQNGATPVENRDAHAGQLQLVQRADAGLRQRLVLAQLGDHHAIDGAHRIGQFGIEAREPDALMHQRDDERHDQQDDDDDEAIREGDARPDGQASHWPAHSRRRDGS
jgi:hypothetical protein